MFGDVSIDGEGPPDTRRVFGTTGFQRMRNTNGLNDRLALVGRVGDDVSRCQIVCQFSCLENWILCIPAEVVCESWMCATTK
jgi:hypothetical protein